MDKVSIACCRAGCGVTWWVTSGFYHERKRMHDTFYCPNGHEQHFTGVTAETKLNNAERLLKASRRKEDMLRRELAKTPCPHCGKRLANLAKHIKTQHPGKPMPAKKAK